MHTVQHSSLVGPVQKPLLVYRRKVLASLLVYIGSEVESVPRACGLHASLVVCLSVSTWFGYSPSASTLDITHEALDSSVPLLSSSRLTVREYLSMRSSSGYSPLC